MPSETAAAPPPTGPSLTCARCRREAPPGARAGAVALTWTVSVENGQRRTYCPECSREHLRAMEAKLDSEHW